MLIANGFLRKILVTLAPVALSCTTAFAEKTPNCLETDKYCARAEPVRLASLDGDERWKEGARKYKKRHHKKQNGSVYGSYGSSVYAKGGALFAGHISNGAFDTFGHTLTAGYRNRVHQSGRLSWWFQPEVTYFRPQPRAKS